MAGFYRVVRVRPNGSEQTLLEVQIADVSEEQARRAQAFSDARGRGSQHIRVYSSDDNGVITPGDCIWDSEVNS